MTESNERPSLKAAIAVAEDAIEFYAGDNDVYRRLKEDMSEHPELADYVASKMRETTDIAEAEKIGKTALVVYGVMQGLNLPPEEQE